MSVPYSSHQANHGNWNFGTFNQNAMNQFETLQQVSSVSIPRPNNIPVVENAVNSSPSVTGSVANGQQQQLGFTPSQVDVTQTKQVCAPMKVESASVPKCEHNISVDSDLSKKVTSILCDPNIQNVLFLQLKNVIASPNVALEGTAGNGNLNGTSAGQAVDASTTAVDDTADDIDESEQWSPLMYV